MVLGRRRLLQLHIVVVIVVMRVRRRRRRMQRLLLLLLLPLLRARACWGPRLCTTRCPSPRRWSYSTSRCRRASRLPHLWSTI